MNDATNATNTTPTTDPTPAANPAHDEIARSYIRELARRREGAYRKAVTEFQEKFATNPAVTLEWHTEGVVKAQHIHAEMHALAQWVERESPSSENLLTMVRSRREYLTGQLCERFVGRARSTSPVANACEDARGEAFCELRNLCGEMIYEIEHIPAR